MTSVSSFIRLSTLSSCGSVPLIKNSNIICFVWESTSKPVFLSIFTETRSRTDKGKPYLVNTGYPSLSFNVSHQGDYTILVADNVHNVGVDIMKIEYPSE